MYSTLKCVMYVYMKDILFIFLSYICCCNIDPFEEMIRRYTGWVRQAEQVSSINIYPQQVFW